MIEGRTLFQWFVENRLGARQMLCFLLSMGDFCTRTRDLGTLPSVLTAVGRAEYAARLEAISVSERAHCVSYAKLALELLRQVGHPLTDWLEENEVICERLFQSLGGVSDVDAQKLCDFAVELAQRTYAPIFRARNDGSRGAFYALGVTRAVECVADEIIIPGEIAAFGPTGLYGLSLDHPNLFYIKEHAAELDGAEGWHHAFMDAIYEGLSPDERHEADLGQQEAEAAIAQWFSLLLAAIKEGAAVER